MRQLATLDKALLLIVMPLWALCFGLQIKAGLRPLVTPHLYVEPAQTSDGHPRVVGFHLFGPEGPRGGLEVGDRLLRLGDADLSGKGPVEVFARSIEQAGPDRQVTVVYERADERGESVLALRSDATAIWAFLPVSAISALVGALVLLRGRPAAMARAVFAGLLCLAFQTSSHFGGSALETFTAMGVHIASVGLLIPLSLRAILVFPGGTIPSNVWLRLLPWSLAGRIPFHVSGHYGLGFPLGTATVGYSAFSVLAIVAVFIALAWTYRRVNDLGRRRLRWVLFGFYCGLLPILGAALATAFDPRLAWMEPLAWTATILIPISLFLAMVRYNIFDIDRWISATVSYNVALVVAGAGALTLVPRAANALSETLGLDQTFGQITMSILVAALVVPIHGRVRPSIERLFFEQRQAFNAGIEQLVRDLARCRGLKELTALTGERIQALLRPESSVIYSEADGGYEPVFVEGRAVPPRFAAGSPLAASLAARRAPLSLGALGRRPDDARLGPFDRAALETLQAEVVVPVHQDDELVAFLCLGPKSTGDVYTATDVSLLAIVARAVSGELRRFDQEANVREARAMQESLRRYVPGAVANELSAGEELSSGERAVSVLFVDLRGYTSFSEDRCAEEIFSTVNAYTVAVSEIVQGRGGSVVEFNGDGMMAVFGAPRELAHKEQAAVDAGREICEVVGEIRVDGGETRLAVGVGIATGEAFVGNIRAVDRMIWSAIGNTTNLAARLQSLSRELDAAIVIDEATWQACNASGFERREAVEIRGRSDPRDVYVLSPPRARGPVVC